MNPELLPKKVSPEMQQMGNKECQDASVENAPSLQVVLLIGYKLS